MTEGRVILEIDCAPGTARPDTYATFVFNALGVEYKEPLSKFFGNWTWHIQTLKEVYDGVQPDISNYLKEQYNKGYIRYASWNFENSEEASERDKKAQEIWDKLQKGESVELNL